MVLLLLLLAIVVWAGVATAVELRRDGYRPTPTDWNRVPPSDSLQRAETAHGYR